MKRFEFIYINNDGSARELTILEKLYLRTKYHGADGDRPYIKLKYSDKNGRGNLCGFCSRKIIPESIKIELWNISVSAVQIQNEINRIKNMGYEIDFSGIEEECSGTV